jgi:hypothetical protein
LVMRRLASRIGKDGVFRVISQQASEFRRPTRELAIERFAGLLRDAPRQVPIRKQTLVGKRAKLRRLEEKQQQSMLKRERSKKAPVED